MNIDPEDREPLWESNFGSDKKVRLYEVSVLLFLIVPSMALSFFAVKQGALSFVLVAWATILRDAALVCLILFFLWRNGEPAERVGWNFKNFWREVAVGVGLFIPLYFGAGLLENLLQKAGLSLPLTPVPSYMTPGDMPRIVLAVFLVTIVAVAEETIFRGYLIMRFQDLNAGAPAAIVLSAFIFSIGHGYEGTAGVITVGVMGLALALIYFWRQSLVAPMIMHCLVDFVSIVVLPVLGMR
jgi:membrane protease YdiL (CAAX protease family)